jgi:hypothetical protein
MSTERVEGRPAPDPRNPHDQATKRPRDAARQRELDQVVREHRGKGPIGDVGEARRVNQGGA